LNPRGLEASRRVAHRCYHRSSHPSVLPSLSPFYTAIMAGCDRLLVDSHRPGFRRAGQLQVASRFLSSLADVGWTPPPGVRFAGRR
jgi:hypothetical protein